MKDVGTFLAHAIKLEDDAAHRFADLAEAMKTCGNHEVAGFFSQMAQFSRLHMIEARQRSAFHDMPDLGPDQYQWPEGGSPEVAAVTGSPCLITAEYAMQLALESEKRGFAFYDAIARTSTDPVIRQMAEAFAEEEAEHVAELEQWAARFPVPA